MPEGWEWTRINNIAFFQGGYAYKSNRYVAFSNNLIIRIGNVKNKTLLIDVAPVFIDDQYAEETANYKLQECDILFTMTGTKGKRDYFYSCIIEKSDIIKKSLFLNQGVGCLRIIEPDTVNPYLFLSFIQSTFVLDSIFSTETGNVNQGNIGSTATLNLLIPIPPIEEQKRVINCISTVNKFIDTIESDKTDLQTTIQLTKSKILDLAIRGKLVPQDPNDEPASVLLERIRAEKEELIKQGKIKRDKKESVIFKGDDNSYYLKMGNVTETLDDWSIEDIPDSWCVCCLGEVCDYGNCTNVDTKDIPETAWILDLEDIEKGTGKVLQKLTLKERNSASTKHLFHKGQVLYSKLRPYLNKVVLADDDGFCTSEILPLDFNGYILPEYAKCYMMSPTFLRYANHCSYGVKMPRLGTLDGKKAVLTVPPINEQKRIADKVSQLFSLLDSIAEKAN